MDTVTLANGVEFQTGCIFDGHYGWHNTYRLIDLAEEQSKLANNGRGDGGYVLDEQDRQAVDAFRMGGSDMTDSQVDTVYDLADNADTYLNGLAPDGYSFGWEDGEYFFQSSEWFAGYDG